LNESGVDKPKFSMSEQYRKLVQLFSFDLPVQPVLHSFHSLADVKPSEAPMTTTALTLFLLNNRPNTASATVSSSSSSSLSSSEVRLGRKLSLEEYLKLREESDSVS